MDSFYFLSFDSTNHALQAESYLKNKKLDISIIPTPREVTQSCGLSIKFNDASLGGIKGIIGEGSLKIKGLYYFERANGVKDIQKVDLTQQV